MGREYPTSPLPSCHALVRWQGQILLVRRGHAPLQGYWGLPGGGVELGETVEAAVVREVEEETGLRTRVTRFLGYTDAIEHGEQGRVRWHYVILYFEAEPTGGHLKAADDADMVRWVTPAEAGALQLTDAVERCLTWSAAEAVEGRGRTDA